MNEEKTDTYVALEGSAFGRVLGRLMETRGIPADQEHALELAERSGLNREVFRAWLAGEEAAPGDLTRFAEELALSIPEMEVLTLAYTLEKERELENPTEEKTVRELNEENATTTEERALPCFVRHEDAGGQCFEPGVVMVYGLSFCTAHGEEARIGAALEAFQDAEYFFERFRNPHVPKNSDVVEQALKHALARSHDESPSDEDYDRALLAAYPELPEAARRRVVRWQQDEVPGEEGVLDTILRELHTLHRLLRIAHADGVHWLVEVLEEERHPLAAQAAYVLRNPKPPEPDDG